MKFTQKITLSSNDDKRLQTFDRITTYPHRANAFKICESEMMLVGDLLVESYADCQLCDEIILQPQAEINIIKINFDDYKN